MTLTASSSLGLARRKFFMNSTYSMSRKKESNVFWRSEGQNESNSQSLVQNGEKKIFHEFGLHHI